MKPVRRIGKKTLALLSGSLVVCGSSDAHIVALGWKSLGGGTVEFSALHWHGNHETAGALIFDDVSYPFTSVTWDTPVLGGFNGALINSEYATFGGNTITAIAGEENWLHVTITGVGPGTHTVTALPGPGQLTEWTLDGSLSTFEFNFEDTGEGPRQMAASLRSSSITAARTVTRDVGARLFRLRSGVESEPVTTTQAAPSSAKGGAGKSPISMTSICRWEVYGQVFYSAEDLDALYLYAPVVGAAPIQTVLQPDTSIDVFGGTVGFEYDFNSNWSAGFAISGARSDVDLELVGSSDIDTLALIPYVSYRRPIGSMGFYADLLYGYGMNDYSTFRVPGGITGSTDGEFNTLELNSGLNFRSGSLVHGPYGQLRWLDGDIDGYTEIGFGGAVFPDSSYESLATQLGYQVSYPMAMGGGTLVPQGRVAWEHEFEADQGNVFGVPTGELDEDLAVLGAGVGYYMNCGWNVVLDYEARLGSENQSHYVGLKVGREF